MQTLTGKVIRGRGYGHRLGYPTANLDRREYARLRPKLRLGIYAGTATILDNGHRFRAALVLGLKDKTGLPRIEAHLLGFTDVLYGRRLALSFIRYLRPFMSFRKEGEDVLKKQIKKDIARVKKLINLTQW